MTKADKIEQWIVRIGAIGTAFFALRAIDAAVKAKARADYDAKYHPDGVGSIGTAQAIASRKRLAPYFNGDYLISKVAVDLTERKGKYVDVTIYFYGRMPIGYWVSMEDIKWLTELCERLGEDIVFYE